MAGVELTIWGFGVRVLGSGGILKFMQVGIRNDGWVYTFSGLEMFLRRDRCRNCIHFERGSELITLCLLSKLLPLLDFSSRCSSSHFRSSHGDIPCYIIILCQCSISIIHKHQYFNQNMTFYSFSSSQRIAEVWLLPWKVMNWVGMLELGIKRCEIKLTKGFIANVKKIRKKIFLWGISLPD